MTDTVDTKGPRGVSAATAPSTPMTPRAFVEQLERLATTRPAADVVAFYERYGPAIQPLLRGNDRLSVAAIMEVADTVVEYGASVPANGASTVASATHTPRDPTAPKRGHP